MIAELSKKVVRRNAKIKLIIVHNMGESASQSLKENQPLPSRFDTIRSLQNPHYLWSSNVTKNMSEGEKKKIHKEIYRPWYLEITNEAIERLNSYFPGALGINTANKINFIYSDEAGHWSYLGPTFFLGRPEITIPILQHIKVDPEAATLSKRWIPHDRKIIAAVADTIGSAHELTHHIHSRQDGFFPYYHSGNGVELIAEGVAHYTDRFFAKDQQSRYAKDAEVAQAYAQELLHDDAGEVYQKGSKLIADLLGGTDKIIELHQTLLQPNTLDMEALSLVTVGSAEYQALIEKPGTLLTKYGKPKRKN
jgi:hypothetical protein